MTNQQLKAHCEDVIANPQDYLYWVVDMAKEALAAITQPASPALKLPDVQEQVIGVWNPSANEIAVRKLSGIKVVDFAHWHCHCTKEVVIRDISDHPAILNAPHTAPIEPICATGGAEWVKVPREPTQKMIDAHMDGMVKGGAMTAYRQMLAAADELSN